MTSPNPRLRAKVTAFARRNGICSICWSRVATPKYTTCTVCRDRKKANKLRHKIAGKEYDKEYYAKHHEREKQRSREYKAKHKKDIGNIEKAVKLFSKL